MKNTKLTETYNEEDFFNTLTDKFPMSLVIKTANESVTNDSLTSEYIHGTYIRLALNLLQAARDKGFKGVQYLNEYSKVTKPGDILGPRRTIIITEAQEITTIEITVVNKDNTKYILITYNVDQKNDKTISHTLAIKEDINKNLVFHLDGKQL